MQYFSVDKDSKYIRILSSAESFGYGPCSKLISITKELKDNISNLRIDFLGEDSALSFALQNNHIFSVVQEYNGVYPNAENFDLVLSVMNPYMILWGWFHRKICVYVDSLYWFWKFEEDSFEKLESVIEQIKNVESIDEMWALVKDVSGHNLHYIAHKLATTSCCQHFGESGVVDIFRKNIKNIVWVNPIVDLSYKKKEERDIILISLGGLLSPLNRVKEALAYIDLMFKISEDFVTEASKKYEVILATSPEVTKMIKEVPLGMHVKSLSQEDMLQTINKAAIVLTPAGITTIYECLAYETPFFILPELHDGHYSNFLRLAGKNSGKAFLKDVLPNALIAPLLKAKPAENPDQEIKRIQSVIKMLNITNDKTIQAMRLAVNSLSGLLEDKPALEALTRKQSELILGLKNKKHKDLFEVIKKTIFNPELPAVKKKSIVGIISSAIAVKDPDHLKLFNGLGKYFAKNNINIATGAGIGIPHVIGVAAKDSGSRLFGFSPSTNSLTHSRSFDNAPISDFDVIHFNGEGFTARSLEFIKAVDALVMTSGRMGTLSEFTIGFEEGVPIFVLKGFGGISDHIEDILLHSKKEGLIPPVINESPDKLLDDLLKLLNLTYYK